MSQLAVAFLALFAVPLSSCTVSAYAKSGAKTTKSSKSAPTGFSGGYPAAPTADRARDEADFQRAVTAYRFWYPAVSMEGIFNGNRESGARDGADFPILSAAPNHTIFTANSDTPYGGAAIDLKDGPIVVELPAGSYIGLADDHYQGWILDMGIPGPDAGKGGRHLLVPPGYKGALPTAGYYIGHAASNKVLVAVRSLPQNGDAKAALEALRKVRIYPYATAANPKLMGFVDVSEKKIDMTPLRWEGNLQYWAQLQKIVDGEPIVEKFAPMYGLLSALGIEKGKAFAPDARMKGVLERAAKAGREQMLVSAFATSRKDALTWKDRKWEWAGLAANAPGFDTPNGMDLEARDRWFAQAIIASPAMFRREEGAGSLYWLGARDAKGAFLDGGKNYMLNVPAPVPGKLFWSVTVYDAQTRSEVQTDQGKAALRSLFELKDAAKEGTTALYFGPQAPAGQEDHWIQTTPGRGWFAYFRIYGPEKAAFDGTWKPGDFEERTRPLANR